MGAMGGAMGAMGGAMGARGGAEPTCMSGLGSAVRVFSSLVGLVLGFPPRREGFGFSVL